MLIKATDVIGLPVFTLKKGEEIDHTIQDVVYDPHTNKVAALLLDKGGWFSDAKVILTNDIHNIGKDAVIIESADKIKMASHVKQKVSNIAKGDNYLTADQVITEDGTDLGTVSDLIFDSTTGQVKEFEVSQGALKDVQSGRKAFKTSDIITVGEDAMIVGGYTEAKFEKQGQKKGLEGTMHTTTSSASSIAGEIKEKAQELTRKAQEKVQEVRESPRTQELGETVREKTAEATKTAQQTAQQERKKMEEKRRKDAVGKYLTINILSQKDKILAKRGDMITHHLLQEAEANDILDQVLDNVTDKPLQPQQASQEQMRESQEKIPRYPEPDLDAIIIEEIPPSSEEYGKGQMYGTLGGKATPTKTKKPRKNTKKASKK